MENLIARHVENIGDLDDQEYFGFRQSDERSYFDEPFESDSDVFNEENKTNVTDMTSKEPSESLSKRTPCVDRHAQVLKIQSSKNVFAQKSCGGRNLGRVGARKLGIIKGRRDLSLPANQIGIGVEVWEANQHLVAKLRSENDQLRRELHVNKLELKTVQRECKVQGVRLSKAIGKEATMPVLLDRLQAEVRSLQIQLRKKSEQLDTSDRKVVDLEQRLMPLLDMKERDFKQQSGQSDEQTSKKQNHIIESQKVALERETKLTCELKRKFDLLERTSKYEQGAGLEQVRQFRRIITDLQTQLDSTNRQLQEKTKLLELQNIYSQRLPKSVFAMTASTKSKHSPPNLKALHKSRNDGKLSFSKLSERVHERSISSERLDKEFDQVFNRRYTDFRQQQHDANNEDSPRLNSHEPQHKSINEMGSAKQQCSQQGSSKKKNKKIFNRCPADKTEDKSSSEGILNNVLKRQSMLKETRGFEDQQINLPIPASRKHKGVSGDKAKVEKTVTIAEPNYNFPKKVEDFESCESFEYNKNGTRWRSVSGDNMTMKTSTADADSNHSTNNASPNLEALQAELSRITERHEILKTEVAGKCKTVADVVNIVDPVKKHNVENAIAVSARHELDVNANKFTTIEIPVTEELDRFEMCKEDRLWEDLFGKDSDDLSGILASPISHYPPCDDEDKTRIKYSMKTCVLNDVVSSSESGKKSRGRQLSSISRRDPFEDLDVEEVPL